MTVCRKDLDEESLADLKNEIEIMQELSDPNIVQLLEVFEDKHYIYLIIDFLEYGSVRGLQTLLSRFFFATTKL